jgi:hypothetical protein
MKSGQWNKEGVTGDPVKLSEQLRGFIGRTDAWYDLMGFLTEREFAGLIAISRTTNFMFAICGSLAETPRGLRARNQQQHLSRGEVKRHFPKFRRNGIPAFSDVDLWFDKVEARVLGELGSVNELVNSVAILFELKPNEVDTNYAKFHVGGEDYLNPLTSPGYKIRSPGAILFDRGDTRRYYSSWHYLSLGMI